MHATRTFTALKLIAALLLILSSRSSSAQNLLVNAGFENGTSNWGSGCGIEIYPETTYGGTNASNHVTEIDVERCLHQDVAITPGQFYKLSYRAARRMNGAPATVGVNVRVIGRQSGTLYLNLNRTYTQTTWAWVTEEFLVFIPAGVADHTIRVRFNNYLTIGTYGTLLDDIVFQLDASAAMLPLVIHNFSASTVEAGVQLHWNASNVDQEGKHFEIERMTAGGAFQSIAQVAVQDNEKYSFVDHNAPGAALQYRIKAVNRDGSASYSTIVSVQRNAAAEIQLYPNPAISSISVSVRSHGNEMASISVLNSTGMVVAVRQASLRAGDNKIQLDLNGLKPGMFYLRISCGEGQTTKAFCKR